MKPPPTMEEIYRRIRDAGAEPIAPARRKRQQKDARKLGLKLACQFLRRGKE